jgi:TPR repeat protein
MYDAGQGVAKDAKQAADWFGKAGRGGLAEDVAYDELPLQIVRKKAEQGDGYAQSSLGRRYERGRGVAKDLKQAAFWLRKAAEQRTIGPLRSLRKKAAQGEAAAQSGLGFLYFGADGVLSLPGDATQGAVWQRKAAEQGYANAQYQLAEQYEHGQGVAKDLKQAEFWRRKWEAQKK